MRKKFDREVQRCKRLQWYSLQNELLNDCNVNQSQFWKSIGIIGVGYCKKNGIPMEVILDDGSVSKDVNEVLDKWNRDFCTLFSRNYEEHINIIADESDTVNEPLFNDGISILEVITVIKDAKLGKACGIDNIHVESLKNNTSVLFLHSLFNICFNRGVIPSIWGKCIINPIPKSAMNNP